MTSLTPFEEYASTTLFGDVRLMRDAADWRSNWRRHAANLALLALVLVALYWRVFFFGETIIDVRTLDNQLPWGYDAPTESYHPYNRRDPTDMYLTREYFIVQSYADGELPLWNPYTFTGHPIYADGVTRIFSPFLLVYGLFDMPLGYSLARLAELLLGAVFLYLYLIAIGVSARGALLGALVFELSAHSLFHLTGLGWWGGLLWLPLIFLFADRALRRNDWRAAILAGVFVAMQLTCGYMPNQIYYLAAVTLYYLVFGWRARQWFAEAGAASLTAARLVLMTAVTLAVGLALAATQWLPVMELLGFSNRRVVPTEAGYIYLPPWYIVTLLFPNLFGTAYDAERVTLFTALSVSHDHSLYLGIAALLPLGFLLFSLLRRMRKARRRKSPQTAKLAGSRLASRVTKEPQTDGKTLVERKRDATARALSVGERLQARRVEFFAGLLLVALVVMMAAPVYVYVTQYIPVLRSIRVIVRVGVLFLFAAAVLVGFGADALLAAGRAERRRFGLYLRRLVIALLALSALGVAGFYLLRASGFLGDGSMEYVAGSGRQAYLRSVLSSFAAQFAPPGWSVLLPLVMLLVAYVLFHLWQRGSLDGRRFFWLLVAFLLVDLSANSLQYDGTHQRERVFPATAITDRLKTLPPGRVLVAPSGIESNRRARRPDVANVVVDDAAKDAGNDAPPKIIAPPNTLLAYRIPTLTGKDQLFPKAYREFCALIEAQPHLSHVVFNKTASPYFDLLNAKYILTTAANGAPPNSELLLAAEGLALYENKSALPRAFFVESAVVVSSQAEALSRLGDAAFDSRATAVLERAQAAGGAMGEDDDANRLSAFATAGARAQLLEERRNHLVIETENAGAGLLVLSDTFYPGWQATIDGEPAEILRANYTMRAVRVPAGRHMVSFTFAPQTLRAATMVSLLAAALVCLSLFLLRKKTGAVS